MSFDKNIELLKRAENVTSMGAYFKISDGATGISDASEYPFFATGAEGAYIFDADGNKYLDLISGGGVSILGYKNADTDTAFINEAAKGICTTLLLPVAVELAEKVVETVKSAEFATFTADGESALMTAIMAARSSGKKKLIFFRDGRFACSPILSRANDNGVLVEDVCNNLYVPINDIDALRDILKKYDGEIAAMVVTPYLMGERRAELPVDNYWKDVRHILNEKGVALIFDDTVSGLHLSAGGSDFYYGIEADMICFGRGIANGYPIGCVAGKNKYKTAVAALSRTDTGRRFSPSMAAAKKCMDIVSENDVIRTTEYLSRRLMRELGEVAEGCGFIPAFVGDGSMFRIAFGGDDGRKYNEFCNEMAKRGVLLSRRAESYINYSVTESDITFVVEQAAAVLQILRR